MSTMLLSAAFGFLNDILLLLMCALCIYAVWKIPPVLRRRSLFLLLCGVAGINLLAAYVDTLPHALGQSVLSYLLTVLPLYGFITLLYRQVNLKCCAVSLACHIVSSGLGYLTTLLKYPGVFDLADVEMYYSSLRMDILFRAVLCVGAAFWCLRTAKRTGTNWTSYIRAPIFLLCSGMFISYFVLIWLLFAPPAFRENLKLTATLVILFTAFFFIAIPYVLRHLVRAQFFGNFVKQQLDTQVSFYEKMQEKNRDMHRFRHDCVNYMQCIRDLLHDGKTQEALDFMRSMDTELASTRQEFYSGNYLLDAILSDKQSKAAEADTTIEWDGAFPQYGIENVDLCAIVANALDNAIEECRRIDGPCTITVASKQAENIVYLRICNPVRHAVHIHDDTIETTKPDKVHHGFGLLNIKKAAEKYDGSMHPCVSEDGRFILDIELRYC